MLHAQPAGDSDLRLEISIVSLTPSTVEFGSLPHLL